MFDFALPPAELRVLPDLTTLRRSAVHEFSRAALDAVTEQGRFTVALADGPAARAIYEMLALGRRHGHPKLPWSRIHFFFGVERALPADHPNSHFRMASECLFSQVAVPSANVHRINTEVEPAQAAVEYEKELRRHFNLSLHGLPRFDLILLEPGNDGRVAALCPGSPALREARRLVCVHPARPPEPARFTFTLPVLNAAAEVVFVGGGADLAPLVRTVWHVPARRTTLPAERVRPVRGRVLWLVDEAAASGLTARAG
jgi:6-phosphogluconolactonase